MESNVNSYDIAQKPFIHDKDRGKWEKKTDFHMACVGHAFRVRNFCIFVIVMEEFGGVQYLIPIMILAGLFMIPIIFVQSFLGQFSNTGYISAFRIAPLFKGVGYVILFLNISTIIYSSSMATVPLLYIFHSFGSGSSWIHCNNAWNTPNCSETFSVLDFGFNKTMITPLWEYFQNHVVAVGDIDQGVFQISWSMSIASVFLWILLGFIVLQPIQMIGKLLRYSTILTVVVLGMILIRVLFAVGLSELFGNPSLPDLSVYSLWAAALLAANTMMGSGWGVTLTLSSYNRFSQNIEKLSWTVSAGLMGAVFLASTLTHCIDRYIEREVGWSHVFFQKHPGDFSYIGFPRFAASLEATHLWCFLFYVVLFLSEINSIVIQTMSVLTAVFDEYPSKRAFKKENTIILCGALFTLSLFFNNTYGFRSYAHIDGVAFAIQLFICFLELIMIVWIYGRERFIRDVSFMLGKPFQPWKFKVLRFIYPLLILCTAFWLLEYPYDMIVTYDRWAYNWFIYVIKLIPFLIIPCLMTYKLWTITGTPWERLKKSVRPVDWSPGETLDKNRYDLLVTSSDVTQHLVEVQTNDSLH